MRAIGSFTFISLFLAIVLVKGSPAFTNDWHPLGPGIEGAIVTIALSGNDVYVGGNFLNAGGIEDADYLARWDGCEWHAVGGGLNGTVNDIEINGENIYIAGEFTAPVSFVGYWNGVQWIEMGGGLNAQTKAIELDGSSVYAAGNFTDAGGNSNADYVALWNGTTWQNLGASLNNSINDMEWNGGYLYILGDFTDAGGNTEADHISRWNVNTWENIGTTIQEFPPFTYFGSLELYGNDVWIGGNFGIEGIQQMVCLARWNGVEWSAHFSSTISALNIVGNTLYASSGATDCAFLMTSNLINNTWSWIPGCLETYINVFASNGTDIYAGGFFWATPPYTGCPYCHIMRYGAPESISIIEGVPTDICQTDSPILLPTNQSGFTGNWSGPGVYDNIFDPFGLDGTITITFTRDDSGCIDSIDFIISVIKCYIPPPIDWIWAKAISGDNSREEMGVPGVYAIATDTANEVYTAGYFYGSVDFNPGPGEFFMSPLGTSDGFVCKLNTSGQFVWAIQIGGEAGGVIAYDITTDDSGGIYITGGFSYYADFDPGPQTHFLYSIGEEDLFILKLNYNGQFQWVKNLGGDFGNCRGTNIKVEAPTGNVYTTGAHSGEIDFDPGPGTYMLGNSDLEYNIFISKLDNNGNFIWAKEIQGSTDIAATTGTSIAVDPINGNVYTTGQFYGTCDFDPGNGIDNITSNGSADIFLLKLDSNGNHIWAHHIGGNAIDYCPSIALGSPGNEKIYLSGGFSETVDFDPGSSVFNLTSAFDLFVCKLDSSGNFIWARSLGGASGISYYTGSYLCVDTLHRETVSLTGGFLGTADFDPGPETFLLTSNGGTDIFLSKIDSSGNFIFVKTAGGAGNDAAISLALDHDSKFLITGNYESPTLPFDETTLTNTDDPNVFVAKAGGCTTIVTNTNNSGEGSLRDVIQCAQSGDFITFSLAPISEIILTSGEIIIDKDLTLQGSGLNNLTLSGNNASRIFKLTLDSDFHVENISLKNGATASNGGALFAIGNLTLKNALLENNFENGVPKSLTLISPGSFTSIGNVELRY